MKTTDSKKTSSESRTVFPVNRTNIPQQNGWHTNVDLLRVGDVPRLTFEFNDENNDGIRQQMQPETDQPKIEKPKTEFEVFFNLTDNQLDAIQMNAFKSHWGNALKLIINTRCGQHLMIALGKVIPVLPSATVTGYENQQKALFLDLPEKTINHLMRKRKVNPDYSLISSPKFFAITLFHELVHAWHDNYSLAIKITPRFWYDLMVCPEFFCNCIVAYNNLDSDKERIFTAFYKTLVESQDYVYDDGRDLQIYYRDLNAWIVHITNTITTVLGSNFLPLGLALEGDMIDDLLTMKPTKLTNETFNFLASQLGIPVELAYILNENTFRAEIGVPYRNSYNDR